MEIIYITIPVTLVLITLGTLIFFWASKSGQYDDMEGPAHRILFDDDDGPASAAKNESESLSPDEQPCEASSDATPPIKTTPPTANKEEPKPNGDASL